jgi:hypothetical protein
MNQRMKKLFAVSLLLAAVLYPLSPVLAENPALAQTTTTRGALIKTGVIRADTSNTATATGTGGTSTVTLSKVQGTITCGAITTAAAGTHVMTVTNTLVTASSIIVASVNQNGSTGLPVITSIEPGSGSFVIRLSNLHASAAFNAAPIISYVILK